MCCVFTFQPRDNLSAFIRYREGCWICNDWVSLDLWKKVLLLLRNKRQVTLCRRTTTPSRWDCGLYLSSSRCAHPLLLQPVSLSLCLSQTFTHALHECVNELNKHSRAVLRGVVSTCLKASYIGMGGLFHRLSGLTCPLRKKSFCHCGSSFRLYWIKTFFLPGTSKPKRAAAESRCYGRACNPRMGNLAQGRVLMTQSVCGFNSSEPYCFYKQTAAPRIRETCSAAKCSKCNSAIPSQAHPPSAMSDSSFRYPDTWWQSAEGVKEETLQLDLETEFLLTHLILVFRSPRPAAMVLERSQDRGRTWGVLRYFARDCEEAFGLTEGSQAGESGATCTSKYSGAFPCSRGEVGTGAWRLHGMACDFDSLSDKKGVIHDKKKIANIYKHVLIKERINIKLLDLMESKHTITWHYLL